MNPLPFDKPQDTSKKSALRGVDTNYMLLPMPNVNTTSKLVNEPVTLLSNNSGMNRNGIWNDTDAIANELDDLIIKF